MIDRCIDAHDGSDEILAEAEAMLSKLTVGRGRQGQWLKPCEVMEAYPGGLNGFLQPSTEGSAFQPLRGRRQFLMGISFHYVRGGLKSTPNWIY